MEEPPAKKPRGQKQRLAAMQAPAESTRPSALVAWLEEQWAWGYMSAQCIQKIASLSVEDMVACGVQYIPQPLQTLASIGTFGNTHVVFKKYKGKLGKYAWTMLTKCHK